MSKYNDVFTVGDFITGTKESNHRYSGANEKMTKAVVIAVYDDTKIKIKILEYPDYPSFINCKAIVDPKYFKYCKE